MILWTDRHGVLRLRWAQRRLERLAAFIDGTLEHTEQRRVSEHVSTCEPCLRLVHEARALLDATGASRQP